MPLVLFGISGSIAAYRALEVIRLLVAHDIETVPILSPGGMRFVTRHAVEALSGRKAICEIFTDSSKQEIDHIALAQKADLFVTCPASADILAKYACGICDDPLSLAALAFGTPHLIAPAMNHRMWLHPATQANVQTLRERGCQFVGPGKGMMACGEEGWGRLASVEEIYGHIRAVLGKSGPLAGRRIVVSAGATREAVDDIRFVSNRSSGRMGYALAEAARDMGADVLLVTASSAPPPAAISAVSVETAAEMRDALVAEVETADAFIMAAAVADFTPAEKIEGKIKKSRGPFSIELTPAPDILLELAGLKRKGQVLVGFAAEYGADGVREALRKCADKSCDFICFNDVSRTDIGFASEDNEITIVFPDGRMRLIEKAPKYVVAYQVVNEVASLLAESD